jgi:hypothetical protein
VVRTKGSEHDVALLTEGSNIRTLVGRRPAGLDLILPDNEDDSRANKNNRNDNYSNNSCVQSTATA